MLKYEDRIKRIRDGADCTEKTVQERLNLKRIYASVKDTHISPLISTTIGNWIHNRDHQFRSIAFVTALFALNIKGFDLLKQPDGT